MKYVSRDVFMIILLGGKALLLICYAIAQFDLWLLHCRAVAEYFKSKISSATSDDERGKFSLNGILEGRTRKQAARMFFETLVTLNTKTCSYQFLHIIVCSCWLK
jgi:hypothetical protein